MAMIKTRKQADGTTRYTAIVRVRSGQKIVHSESKTFSHRSAAASWARHREVALENPEELRRAQEQKRETSDAFLLRTLIRWYIDAFKKVGNWQRTKQSHLEFLERHPIGCQDARR